MAHMWKKQSNNMASPSSSTPSSSAGNLALGIHRDSRVISKIQPKIRIIHIFAPEIIKTDVANFRELVQRLTGKPSPENNAGGKGKGKKVKRAPVLHHQADDQTARMGPTVNTQLEVMMGTTAGSSTSSDDHHDQEVWRSSSDHNNNNTSGGYLTAFTDLDDNCFDFSTVFHMGASDHGSSHLNSFGENTQLSFRG